MDDIQVHELVQRVVFGSDIDEGTVLVVRCGGSVCSVLAAEHKRVRLGHPVRVLQLRRDRIGGVMSAVTVAEDGRQVPWKGFEGNTYEVLVPAGPQVTL